jgi:serine protease Do
MKNKNLLNFGLISSGVVVVALFLYFTVFKEQIFAQQNVGASKPPIEMNSSVKVLNDAFQSAAEAVIPSVVSVKVKITPSSDKSSSSPFFQDFRKFFEDWDDFFKFHNDDMEMSAVGSGVFATTDGYIITNNHVIENADEIRVTTFDRKEYKAKVIGADKLTDLAVLKIEGDGFKPVHFGNIEDVKIGELVIAVGNPLGLSSTVTSGIVSAIGRGGLSLQQSSAAIENFIQTDAPINPGNSGGGLFNLNGSLIGINTAIATKTGSYIGYGFAIPVDLVRTVVSEIIKSGKFTRARLGVRIRTVDETLAKSLGLEEVSGAVVNDVLDNSPAKKAGIEVEDVIIAVDGKKINTSNELQTEIAKRRPGQTVEISIWRNGKVIKKNVKLEPFETDEIVAAEDEPSGKEDKTEEPVTLNKLGIVVAPLTPEQKEAFGTENGVYLSRITRRDITLERGLAPGGVITKVNDKEIHSVREFKKIIDSMKPGDIVRLRVKYKDTQSIVAIEIPEK